GAWIAIRKKRYDLVINAIHHSSSGKISTQFANGKFKFLGEVNDEIRAAKPDYHHMAKMPVYSFRYFLNLLAIKSADAPVPPLSLKLKQSELEQGKQLLRKLINNDKATIGIYTYATGTKCYPPSWWTEFYWLLKERFPEHNILEVLPIENLSQISFKAPSFYSKNLREIASLISNMTVFIAADSGMMHLASASGTPVIGLFKSENISQYAPYNDRSVGVHTDRVTRSEIALLVKTLTIPVAPH
ncbi:MAG TPA: glycosyltransferase family 9 protein, partial [Chryseosolibacter sp.]|nr:glycosyltransferase family 9 protein [Chryseosolibacter sp.]